MRNEAHRFGITHHRKRRLKGTLHTELFQIDGIGEKTAIHLLKQFGSIEAIKNSSIDELQKSVGNHKARLIQQYFKEI